jgi:NitT/TauT family transport system substrate-binding protein
LSDDVVDIALSNIHITSDPLPETVHSFAEQADALGYLGRNGYDLSGIFYYFDTNSIVEEDSR